MKSEKREDHPELTPIRVFGKRIKKFVRLHKAAQHEVTVDVAHDLRVAARRLRAWLDVVESVEGLKPGVVKKIKKQVKTIFQSLSPVRDVHVQQDIIRAQKTVAHAFTQFHRLLLAEEKENLTALSKTLKASKQDDLRFQLRELQYKLKKHTRHSPNALSFAAGKVLKERGADLSEALIQLKTNGDSELHATRVRLKKYRYTLEVVAAFSKASQAIADRLRVPQDTLGEFHDLDLFLSKFLKLGSAENVTLDSHAFEILRDLALKKETLVKNFKKSLSLLNSALP